MKTEIIASKRTNYTWFVSNFVLFAIIAYLYSDAMIDLDFTLSFLYGVPTSLMLIWILWYNRFIYLIINKKEGSILYGNIFFKQEIDLKPLNHLKGTVMPFFFMINIAGKRYFFISALRDKKEITEIIDDSPEMTHN